MLPLNPFPSPVPPWSDSMGPIIVRGNDNLLRGAVNELIAGATIAQTEATSAGNRSANLFDPRLSANDGDFILASQVFGRART